MQIQFSVVDPTNPSASPEEIYQKFKKTVVSADDDDDLAQLPSNESLAGEEGDDGEKDEDTSDETDDPSKPEIVEKKQKKKKLAMLRRKSIAARAYEFTGKDSVIAGIVFLEINKITDLPPEKNSMTLYVTLKLTRVLVAI